MEILAESGRPLITCYLPVGDPAIDYDLAQVYFECGVDIFEVGIPSEDPYVDGVMVKNSMQRVLATKMSQRDMGREIANLRTHYADKAIVLMGYENMQLHELTVNGKAPFDGVLRIGSDHFEGATLYQDHSLDRITFLPYDEREWDIQTLRHARGYIMLQAAPGKTGMRRTLDESNRGKIRMLKVAGAKVPILLGVGISTAEQAAAAVEMGADGVVIGSASIFYSMMGEEAIRNFISEVRGAMDAFRN